MSQLIGELEELINQGRYIEARTKAESSLAKDHEPRIKQLLALAISKSGLPELALETITPLYQQFPNDPESAGILGSIYKELFRKNQKTSFAVLARDTYLKNFQATQNYYTGINAASMSAMAGQGSKGREIAGQVISIVEKSGTGFWEMATLGEAYLLTKNKNKAIESYITARKLAGNDWGKITSVNHQLWLLNHYIAIPGEVLKLFAPPNVVAFSGHMIDQPNRPAPRFPPVIEQQVKEAIRNSIRTLNARIGYSSLACGSDILFVETMMEESGEVNLMLPFKEDDFIKTSVAFAGSGWLERFKKIIASNAVRFTTTTGYNNNDELFIFLSKVIYGAAILRSSVMHSEPYLLTVSSQTDLKRKTGGTKDTTERWPFPQRHININPDIFTITIKPDTQSTSTAPMFEKTPEALMYLVYLAPDGNRSSWQDRINKYNEKLDEPSLKVIAAQNAEESVVVALGSSSAAMEFVDAFASNPPPGTSLDTMKMVLHAGIIIIQSPEKISGPGYKEIILLGNQVSKGPLYSSELFAALLALQTKRYLLQYAGVVKVDDQATRPFYLVERNEGRISILSTF